MINYTYRLIRYLPDRVSGEFVNVGIILFNKDHKYLKAKTIGRIGRVKHLFPNVNARTLVRKLKELSNTVNVLGVRWSNEIDFNKYENINSVLSSIVPNDDSSIIFSKEFTGIDLILDNAFGDLFDRMVNQHNIESEKHVTDKEVWQKHYKSYFEEYDYKNEIKSKTVKTKGDELVFEHAIKNGKWNFLEPVTFDLSRPNTVKDKVYKWVGKLDELDSSKENFNLYLLAILPENRKLKKFIKDRITKKQADNFSVRIIEPKDAKKLAKQIKLELDHL